MKRQFALLGFMGRGGALSKIHELVREMQVSRVMTASLLALPRTATMKELKDLSARTSDLRCSRVGEQDWSASSVSRT